ncbi:hypothetical protein MFIFM68171_05628 [Madurella fahalii]|uniref:Clr5 domain-containing protein n=1 Tax=Madurella fahalii TaxID=1157608 RepID=A0ABQ0GCD4_9PEZI
MASARWEPHRTEILRLFVSEGKSLKEVIAILEQTRGFHASKAQYERKLREWGIRKNRMRNRDWFLIAQRIARRREQNKDSEVYIDGVQCPPSKVRKETARHGFVPTIDKFRPHTADAPSPKTPEGIIICSPGLSSWHIEWDGDAPWLQFLRSIRLLGDQAQLVSTAPWLSAGATSPWLTQDLVRGICDVLERNNTGILQTMQSSSRIAAVLCAIMPEEREGQHHETTEKLCGLRKSVDHLEVLMLQLFLLSNNFTFRENNLARPIEETARLHDERMARILRRLGSNGLDHIKRLLSAGDVTAAAIMEKLFASVLRLEDLSLLQMMLKIGIDLGILIDTPKRGQMSPLEFAATVDDQSLSLQIACLLLSYNAPVNQVSNDSSALRLAVQRKHRELVAVLIAAGARALPDSLHAAVSTGDGTLVRMILDAGARALPDSLRAAVRTGDGTLVQMILDARARALPDSLEAALITENDALIQMILDAGADVNAKFTSWWHPSPNNGFTALGEVVQQGNIRLARTLLAYGADVNILQPVSSYTEGPPTTALGLAAHRGDVEMTMLLLEANARVNLSYPYACPLFLACDTRHTEVIMALLNAGADVPSADASAAVYGSTYGGPCSLLGLFSNYTGEIVVGLCKSLIVQGARITDEALHSAISSNNAEFISLFLSHGVHLSGLKESAFGHAVEMGRTGIAQMLLLAGATLTRYICRIGNMEAADILERAGLLPSVIRRSGPRVLTAAILEGNRDLTERLLGYDIDLREQSGFWCCQCSCYHPSPLDAAVSEGDLGLAKALIGRGSPITTDTLQNAVLETLETGNRDILQTLLGISRRTNHQWPSPTGATVVDMAVQRQNHGVVRLLLESGVDPTGKPDTPSLLSPSSKWNFSRKHSSGLFFGMSEVDPKSVLDTAVNMDDRSMLLMLLNAAEWMRETTGQALIVALKQNRYQLAEDLFGAGASLDEEYSGDYGSCTTLELVVMAQQIPLVRKFLQAGATVDKLGSNRYARTALQRAVEMGHLELVDILLEAGANVNAPVAYYGGATALQLAAMKGYLGIARRLIDEGADVNAAGAVAQGRTALEGAAENGRIDMLQLLLNRGALIHDRKRRYYVRAVKFAELNGHKAAAGLLKSFGGWTESDSAQYADENVYPDSDTVFEWQISEDVSVSDLDVEHQDTAEGHWCQDNWWESDDQDDVEADGWESDGQEDVEGDGMASGIEDTTTMMAAGGVEAIVVRNIIRFVIDQAPFNPHRFYRDHVKPVMNNLKAVMTVDNVLEGS